MRRVGFARGRGFTYTSKQKRGGNKTVTLY
jgi:hypothetical protein